MKPLQVLLRSLSIALIGVLLWPEIPRYQAERQLARVNQQLQDALTGTLRGQAAVDAVDQAQALAGEIAKVLPADARPPLLRGLGLILLQRGAEAVAVLEGAIAVGERPELSINLGRARSLLKDDVGANRAYVRTAWASPAAVNSLPRAMREQVLAEVARLEVELRAGRLQQVPPL